MAFSRTAKDEHTFETLGDTPSAITASEYVRGNTGGTDLEFRSASEVLGDIGAGTMSSFGVTGDSGDVDQTISNGNTLTIAGGDGITTAASNTDALTVTLDLTKDQAWTGSQRATIATDNDGVFDLSLGQNFSCTPAAEITLTFTGASAAALSSAQNGQSGYICLNNSGTKSILGDTTTFHDSSLLSTLSAGGKFLISYVCDGTYVYITNSAELSAGVS
jgi:hypothetical protein